MTKLLLTTMLLISCFHLEAIKVIEFSILLNDSDRIVDTNMRSRVEEGHF